MGYLLWIVIFYAAFQTVVAEYCPGHSKNINVPEANCNATCKNESSNSIHDCKNYALCKSIQLYNDDKENATFTTGQKFRNEYSNTSWNCNVTRTSPFDKEQELSVYPSEGFMVGGLSITIKKTFKNFDPYMEPLGVKCRNQQMKNGISSCTIPPSNSTRQNLTFISDFVKYFCPFKYLENPVVNLKGPNSSYYWGERRLIFEWENPVNRSKIELSFEDGTNSCEKSETLNCYSPRIMNTTERPLNSSDELTLVLKIDTYKKNIPLTYHPNPKFEKATMENTNITIKGEGFDKAAYESEYSIVAGSEKCTIAILKSNQIICAIQNSEFKGSINITLHSQTKTLEVEIIVDHTISYLIALSCFILLMLIIFFVIYYVHIGRKKQKKGFVSTADTSGQLMSVIVKYGIPFQKTSDYIKRILWTHKPPGNIHYDTQNMSDNQKHILEDFGHLLKNKYFLLPVLKALEKDKSVTQDHKFTYSYHLSIMFSSDLCYFLECCEELFIHLVSQNKGSRSKKLMARSSSITEYLIFNWIGISLYSSIQHIGSILYFFNKDLKCYLETMPIDEVTGNGYKYVFEKYKLMTKTSYEEIKINVQFNGEIKTVTVFTCDTIVKLKKKCLEAFYQGKPLSEIPDVDDICVEYTRTKIEEFKKEENNKGFTQHFILDNWNIEADTLLKLSFYTQPSKPEASADERYITLGSPVARLTTKSNRKFIHLQEPTSLDKEKSLKKKDVNKINLPLDVEQKLMQLMYTFLNRENMSAPLCCLYNMFKKAAQKRGEEKTWFINTYFIQFCCQFIAKPAILLDISQEVHMKKNLEGIKDYAVYLMERCLVKSSREPELSEHVVDFVSRFSNKNADVKELMTSLQSISADLTRDVSFGKEHSLCYLFKMMKTNDSVINSALLKDEKARRLLLSEKFLNIIEEIEIRQTKRV